MRFDPDCPFTEDEIKDLEKLAYAPLDYEIQVLQTQDDSANYIHKSGRKEFEERLKELGMS